MSELAHEQRPPWRLWTIAAVAALCAASCRSAALALAHLKSDDGADGLGANVTEIGVELTSPAAEDTELPPGPDADASVASPALAEQKAEVKPTDLPKETPKESEEPDRVVTQNEQKKPTDDDPKVETVQTAASQESVAQDATARQHIEGSTGGQRCGGAESRDRQGQANGSLPNGSGRSAPISNCTSAIRRPRRSRRRRSRSA